MQKKILGLSVKTDYVSTTGSTWVQLTPHRRPGARLGKAVGANEMDTDIDMR
jgi:hypothetical protein